MPACNNFGFGGTNAHVLVSDTKPVSAAKAKPLAASTKSGGETTAEPSTPTLLVLSARTEDALKALAVKSADAIAADDTTSLADWSNGFGWHRSLLDERLSIVAKSKLELTEALEAFRTGRKASGADPCHRVPRKQGTGLCLFWQWRSICRHGAGSL